MNPKQKTRESMFQMWASSSSCCSHLQHVLQGGGWRVVREQRRNLASALEKKEQERRWLISEDVVDELETLHQDNEEVFVHDEGCGSRYAADDDDDESSSDLFFFCTGECKCLTWFLTSIFDLI